MRAKKVDSNQKRLVEQLRCLPGVTVAHLHTLGDGVPDILVGYKGSNYLLEIKNPELSPSRQKLTLDEEVFHKNWRGQVSIVKDLQDVLNIILK